MERMRMGLMAHSPATAFMPDLSHLTDEERKIILDVMARQKMEEDKEAEILKKTQDEVLNLESAIRQRSEEQRKLGLELDATCQICLKTKFADGIGHQCNYCGVRCCARCGGKVSLRSNKMIWVCILCRKKQELLIKTGQWIHSSMASRLRQLEAETPMSTSVGASSIPLVFDKRLRLERAYSTDKENQMYSSSNQYSSHRRGSLGGISVRGLSDEPTLRSSTLRRQWSQDAALISDSTGVQGLPTTSSWNESIRKLPDHLRGSLETRSPSPHLLSATSPLPPKSYSPSHGIVSCTMDMIPGHTDSHLSRVRLPTDDLTTMTTVESGIGSDTCTSTQAMIHRQGSNDMPRLGNITWSSLESGTGTAIGSGFESASLTSRHLTRSHMAAMQHRQSSYSPSHHHSGTGGHSLMSTCIGDSTGVLGTGPSAIGSITSLGETGATVTTSAAAAAAGTAGSSGGVVSAFTPGVPSDQCSRRNVFNTGESAAGRYSSHLETHTSTLGTIGSAVRLTSGLGGPSFVRTDSSDQSEVQVEPSKVHSREHQRLRLRRERFHRQHFSLSSSEEELRTTPALLRGEDDYSSYYRSVHHLPSTESPSAAASAAAFTSHYSSNVGGHLKREELLDRKIKRFLAHPITWKPSSDGNRLIGHMILKKSLGDEPITGSSAALLGLKVVGGRITGSGTVGAVIEKVKKGSIADTVGKLRPGDEVLEWNGRSLQGLTFEETYDIMAESRQEPQVELIVCRHLRQRLPLPSSPVPSSSNHQQLIHSSNIDPRSGTPGLPLSSASPLTAASSMQLAHHAQLPQASTVDATSEAHYMGHHSKTPLLRRHTDINIQVPHYSPAKPDLAMLRQQSLGSQLPRSRVRVSRSSTISGRIQVKLWYDIQSLQLVVTILAAVELPPRSSGQPRNPFVKILLLPDRSEKSKRRTRTQMMTNDPKWNQTFVYSPLRRSDLKARALELALWDYDRYGCSEFLGEVLIELATAPLDDEPEWYLLGTHEETLAQLRLQQKLYLLPSDRLSPPSTISRLSDSDISDVEYFEHESEYGLNTSRESWRGLLADTSQSSFESAGSPSQRLLQEEYQRESAILHSAQGTSVDAYSSSPTPSMVRHPLRRADLHRLRTHRHPLMTEGMMATSLPSKHDEDDFTSSVRPSFRKSASQPTRSMSPALSLRSPTEAHSSSMVFSAAAHAQAAWSSKGQFYSKKRQLPQVPLPGGRSSRDQINYPASQHLPTAVPTFDPMQEVDRPSHHHHGYRSHFTRTSSGDSMTPQGMYSDSEITARPSYSADKVFYAHPTHRSISGSTPRNRRSKSSVSRSIYSPDSPMRTTEPLDMNVTGEENTTRSTREDTRRESVEFITRRSRIRERIRPDIERERLADEASETSSRISVTEAASAAGSAASSTRTAVSTAGATTGKVQVKTTATSVRETSATSTRSGASGATSGRSLVTRTQAKSLDESASEHRSGVSEATASATGFSGSDSALGPKTASEERLADEASSEAGGSTGGGKDSSASGDVKATGKHKLAKGDLNKAKSGSTSQLSQAGTKKRLGFRKKATTSFSVHRSEEVAPDEVRHLVKQASSASSEGDGSISGDSAAQWVPAMRLQAEGDMSVFVEGLGPGQFVGRQALASVNYGDIQLSIGERKGNVEVEVIRARNLMTKPGARCLPATYVKVYMVKNNKCVAKARTALARRTLDPLYQQQLIFHEDPKEAILRITIYGDYGALDRKSFMGMAQVCLDDLDLSNLVIGWYKLLPPTTMTITNLAPSTALQEAREAKLAAMAATMSFFAE